MPSQNVPNPESFEELLGDALSSYANKIGIDDFNVGSAVTSFFEVAALMTARSSGDIFQILRDLSVDRATGSALQNIAKENDIIPLTATPATNYVTVTDTSFIKISTKVYAGSPSPNIGSITINVSDASMFPAVGAIYIGRGTHNVEGPISYSTPPVLVGNFWTITLNTATVKFHNLNETVILAQGGNRSVPLNAVVIAPAIGANPEIKFSVTTAALILDGETTVSRVPVTAQLPGTDGNVPIGAIKQFSSPPFPGAVATNPTSFTNGQDNETDDHLRIRIKNKLSSIGLGTAFAVKSGVIGAQASDEPGATVVSDDLLQTSYGAVLFIDTGNGYEEKTMGVALESIVDSAIGGERFFQLATGGRQAPVAKAFLITSLSAPFDLIGGDSLAVVVGGQTYQHNFQTSDFRSPGSATAYEVITSINGDTTLGFEATTSGDGSFVVIRDNTEGRDSIQTTTPITLGRDAAVQLGFPSSQAQTLRLYKNQIPLSKDGNTATVSTQAQQLWSPTITNGDTLVLSIDGTDPITYSINNSDFIATGLYNTVASANSLESWVEVFNNKLTGITAEAVGQTIELTSNLGASNRASVVVEPSSGLVTKGMFTSSIGLSSFGQTSDYTLDRNTAQFELVVPLVTGDNLAAGSIQTEARIQSAAIASGNITFASTAYMWILIDNPGQIIPTGIIPNAILGVQKPAANIVRYTTTVPSAFTNVQVGDYLIVWSPDLPSTDRFEGRVHAVTSTTLDLFITPGEWSVAVVVPGIVYTQGFVVVRTTKVPQKFELVAGNYTLDQIVSTLQLQTDELIFTQQQEKYLIVRSRTKDTTGRILFVSADVQAQFMNFVLGSSGTSEDSLIAFYDSGERDAQFPLFVHSSVAIGTSASPPDSYIQSFVSNTNLSGRDPNELIAFLHPYGTILDEQPAEEYIQESSITGTTIGIAYPNLITNSSLNVSKNIRRLRGSDGGVPDRYFVASPLDFGSKDTLVTVIDNNPSSESFEIPLYRKALTNTSVVSNNFTFNAYDVTSGPTASFVSSFGSTFDFANYKVLMQAKRVLKPTPPQTAILYRSTLWGRSGESITVGYDYPTGPNQSISSSVVVSTNTAIFIHLASGTAITTFIDSSTQWNVTITPNTPSVGIDQVTYTWNGVGTNPALSLSGGEYVNITNQSGFSPRNIGVFRVSTQGGFTPTATSFSVQRPTGAALAQSNIPTTVNGSISFYNSSPTTAAQVRTYVNANLTKYFSATLVNDGGTSGSGIIVTSTYEDSGFTFSSVQLRDGLNWLASSNLGGSPQFTLKQALTYPSDGPGNSWYAFNDGETIEFVPTTMEQVKTFTSVLAVTGFTTTGTIGVVDRGTRLELATDVLGSIGAIQIVGGLGNEYEIPILGSGERINNSLMNVSVDSVAGVGAESDQWFRLQATNPQAKEALFSSNTSISIFGNSPVQFPSVSTIQLFNRTLNQRYFGKPRNHVRSRGDTFRIENQGSLVCLSWNGTGTSPFFQKASLNFNSTGGGTVNIAQVASSEDYTYTITSGAANFTELSIGDLLTISGMVFSGNNGTFLVTGISSNGKIVRVLNPNGVNESGTTFINGNFVASSQVSEGDTLIISSPFNVLNQGQFRVIRRYNDSVWFENVNAMEEEVTLPYNPVGITFDATTAFTVNASSGLLHLSWNGTGTEPQLGNELPGDILTLGIDFAANNQGNFMVTSSGIKLQEITTLLMPSTAQFPAGPAAGSYFDINSAGDLNLYRIWFQTGTNVAPAAGGRTLISVNVSTSVTDVQVANVTAIAISSLTGLSATATGNTVTVTTTGSIETTSAVNGTMPSSFVLTIVQKGRRTFVEVINPSASSQSPVLVVSGVLQSHRPQLQFYEYEATVPGDKFVITSSNFTINNVGSWIVSKVLSADSAIVVGLMSSVTNVSLNGIESSVFVQEGVNYSGYKRILFAAAQPAAPTRTLLTFDTNDQVDKIDQSALVQMTALNKLDFNTMIKLGLDSYNYNTGLIAEANRLIYGDPTDNLTYPGIGAAGADIFVRGPLARRIQVGIVIRLNTGVPFPQTASQVRNAVTSLINANPVGKSISISSIVSVVNAIPGIIAVSISSPLYDPNDDLIVLTPGEKAFIINPATDVSVAQVGT